VAAVGGFIRDAPTPFPIAHIHWAMPPVVGGVETHLTEFTEQLARRGHPTTVFTGTPDATPIPGVEIVQHELLNLDTYTSPASPEQQAEWVDKLAGFFQDEILQRGIALVHGHNLHYFSAVPALALNRVAASLGVPLHNTYHSVWPDGLEIAGECKTWSGHHVWSQYVGDFCSRQLGITPTQHYPGIRLDVYARGSAQRTDSSAHRILHPARLVPEKGAELSIHMIKRLRAEGIDASLVLTDGEIVDWTGVAADYRRSIEQLIASLDLGRHVEICSVRFDEMPGLYASADVIVYPSSYPEPLGLVPLEAMAAGRPIIVTRIGGLPETIIDYDTGYIIEPGDLDALVERVRGLILDPGLARRFGAAGRVRAKTQFDLEDYVDWMLAEYRADLR
jgi:glycosyltransferase involved in cell wall biosynthesis